jgi:uncharacterized protein YlaI
MEKKNVVVPKASLLEDFITTEDVGVVQKVEGENLIVYFLSLKKSITLTKDELVFLDLKEYGDLCAKKICNICHRVRPTSEFDLNQNGKGDRPVRRPSCKECRKRVDGIPISSADRKKWNLVKPEYVPFECPICTKITIPPVTSKIVLNHDHKTGIPSGWICDSCNTGLGRFGDSIAILENAILYLFMANQNQEIC